MPEQIPPRIYQLAVQAATPKDLNLAKVVLIASGTPVQGIVVEGMATKMVLKVFSPRPEPLRKRLLLFKRLDVPGLKAGLSMLRPKDWLTLWKTSWRPSRLTKTLDVVPRWHRRNYRPVDGRDFIVMDTVLSFGTGLHETTQMVAQFIEDCRGLFSSFLDIGTGTGILTMVALKNGVRRVLAIDNGELSVQACKSNFKANRLRATVKRKDIAKFHPACVFDFVAANLITHDLITNRHRILALVKPGGYLAVSGISLHKLGIFRRAFKPLPLTSLKTIKGQKWAGLLYQRQMS